MHLLPSLLLALAASPTDLPAEEQGVPPAKVISLQNAIHQALLNSVNIAVAVDEVRRSEALTTEARAGWLPTVTANGLLTHLDHNRTLGSNVIAEQNQQSANLALAVPLFAPKPLTNWLSVRDQEAAFRSGELDTRRTVATSVAHAYLTVLAQHRVLESALRAVASSRAHVAFDQERYKGGVGTLKDLVRSQQQLASDETTAGNARTALIKSRESLGVIAASDEPLDVTYDVALPQGPGSEVEGLYGADHRPDVQQFRDKVHAADATVRHQWADYAPAITATLQPFFQNPPTFNTPKTGWQVLATLTWPIFDGGLRYGQQEEREALLNEAQANLVGGVRSARSEVRSALGSVQFADAALLQARDAARLAHQALDLVTASYRAGNTTNIEVIDTQRAALDADTAAAVAEDTARQARVDLLSATGQLP